MIDVRDITLMRGGEILLQEASFSVFPGHKVGLIGANGSGKSSLFALFRGEISLDSGDCDIPRGWRLASVKQETPALASSALDYVIDGDKQYRQLQQQLSTAEQQDDGRAIGDLHDQIAQIGGYDIEPRAASLLAGLGFSQAQLQQPVKDFSGGWRMRLNLAQALIARADLLLLDEPTNHLDVDAIYWLEGWLQQYDGTLVIIAHDRDFLDNVTQQIVHIEHKTTRTYTGNYSQFERQRAEQLAQQQASFEKEQTVRKHLQTYIDRFRYKASKAKQAQSRIKALEKLSAQAPLRAQSAIRFEFAEPDKLPNPLVTMRNLQAGYGTTVILKDIKFNLVPGSRIGLLGRNGAGKSTLIKLIAGQLEPQAGELALSTSVKLGYFAQHQLELLDPKASALLHLQRLDARASEQQLRDYIGGFGFSGDAATQAVAPMSGGEKARLVLALIIYQKPNLLLLDEPTNHLDLEMREALVFALQSFTGAMIVVSHDRHLLRSTVDDFYLVADQQVQPFDGDLDSYHQWLQQQAKNPDAAAPSEANSGNADTRKAQKRLEAERRQALKPLKDKVRKLEQQVDKLAGALEQINERLADADIYNEARKAELADVLKQQAQTQQQLSQCEHDWMIAEEELQEQTTDNYADN
ncbi:ATP-binding cassette, subfamily F, member 3 [Pseudidiomarina planktonica]|uniref:Probable ATP-binding protein YheS n=1 Tax=Pseudidiomarina planktonica TaxID=1323738 RepID=A0A1Y6EBK5_9GAMM|nr:ATP-binding cassette domain-containing protein [Pseudidiomarina planktonica]RUO66169.1 ABC transporter ATP-binding protein [Pseudidiomarina planktonica]SMQ59958.1 ATP-binding cassette, subfamily F, member 3 [Pseudidiomarina planktonica]